MISERDKSLLANFMLLTDKEREVIFFLLTHNNRYVGTYSDLAMMLNLDASNMRKVVLRMCDKKYICSVKYHGSFERIFWIDSSYLYKLGLK